MYFSAFSLASCAEHQCPLWEDHDSAGLSWAAASSISTRPLFFKVFLENESKPGANGLFNLSSITENA